MRTLQIIIISILLFTSGNLMGQVNNPKEIAKDKSIDRTNSGIDRGIDKGFDKIEEGIGNIFKKKEKKPKVDNTSKESTPTTSSTKANSPSSSHDNQNENTPKSSTNKPPVKSNSKFDFVPGEKVIGFDDFSTTEVGDFPLGWNTNSSAEIVTLNENNQKWLFMSKDGYFQPEFIKDMPENFTIEFEVFTRYSSNNILEYQFYIMPSDNPKRDLAEEYPSNYFQFAWAGCSSSASYFVVENGETISKNEGLSNNDLKCLGAGKNEPSLVKFSIWRQKSRLRIYINEDKVLDIPQAFDEKAKYNVFKFGSKYMNYSNGREQDDEFMVSNIRYAVAGADTRSKLITEGKFSTNEILFDVNSDKIKPESNNIITEIGKVLVENPPVKFKIIGHTDSDGDATANITLSKKRADAVKMRLVYGFGIDETRLTTDGKGESEPLNKNISSEDKAQNRRVEFIKQ